MSLITGLSFSATRSAINRFEVKYFKVLNMCLPPSLVLYNGLRDLGGEIVNQPVGLKSPSDSAVKYPRATTLFLV